MCWWECVAIRNLVHYWWEIKMVQSLEDSVVIPKNLKIELPYDPSIELLDICPKESKVGSRRDITDRWMNKQNMVYV